MVAFHKPPLDDDALAVVVDQNAEPADVDRFLEALDRLVERRSSQRNAWKEKARLRR